MEEQKRALLFNVKEPLEMTPSKFDELWPLVSNVWVGWNQNKLSNGDWWKVWACRYAKHNKSSSRKEGVADNKRRKTMIRDAGLCNTKIKVTRLISAQKVLVERYGNTPDHTHTLEDSDSLKRPTAIKEMIATEAVKSYPPPQVAAVVKELSKGSGLAGAVEYLTTKEVANLQQKLRGPQSKHLFAEGSLRSDIQNTITFLEEKGFTCTRFSGEKNSYQGFSFAQPRQLKKLSDFGWLTLMDSTYKTNKWGWNLFTLYIRDSYGCWDVGGHFFLAGEDGKAVSKGLTAIRQLVPQWKPRYMLIDQSGIESNGIMEVFPGLSRGEQECSVLWCTVHVMRTWMRKITHEEARNKMLLAMHKKTSIGCEKAVQEAITTCDAEYMKRYIIRNWSKNTEKWSMHARAHCPLLLQVSSTNALESYHSELKTRTSKHHGLIGASHGIVELDCKRRASSENVARTFRTKKISLVLLSDELLQEIHKFPFPVQKLLGNEALAVNDRLEKGKPPPGLDTAECHCTFFIRYLLPCRHIFHEHMFGEKLLSDIMWHSFQLMFEESGFEVYEHCERVETCKDQRTQAEKDTEHLRVRVEEVNERLRDTYYNILESEGVAKSVEFVGNLEAIVEPLIKN